MDILDAIDEFWKEHNYGPSYRELQVLLDIKGLATVHRLVQKELDLGNLLCGKTEQGNIMARTLRVFREE